MKSLFKHLVASILALLARAVIRKYKPKIVMVTGSVGKTSTKDAVATVLGPEFFLRASEKSYNSEFGVPFTIFGVKNPWSSPLAWVRVFEEALALVLFPNHYPNMLVLEVGADRPGDLARILRIATPDAVVVTHLPSIPVHVEAYASPRAVHEEEFAPAYALPADAPLVLSHDDGHAEEMAAKLQVKVKTFGFTQGSDVRLTEEKPFLTDGKSAGMEATMTVAGATYPIVVAGALGRPQLYAPAAAFALALSLGIPAQRALENLASYVPPPGRARLLRGVNGSTLIDDSYNASPAAMLESLSALSLMKGNRKIAVLGDMLELGRYSVEEHERVGGVAGKSTDLLVTVGIRAKAVAKAAREVGLPETSVFEYDGAREAADALMGMVEEGDLVLIKGSQGIRTERIVTKLLADPEDTKNLIRQEEEWLLIK